MRSAKLIHVVSCHAEGEVGDVIVGGVAPPPGDTLWAQSRWIAEDDRLRRFPAQRAPRRRVSARQLAGAGEGSAGDHGLHHHGARGHAANVRLELDLCGDGAYRHRARARHRAGREVRFGGAGGLDRGGCGLPRWQGGADHGDKRAELLRAPRCAARGRGAQHVERRHRLWGRQLCHCRREGAWLRHRPRRGARSGGDGREDCRRGQCPARLRTSRERRLATTFPSASLPVRSKSRTAP